MNNTFSEKYPLRVMMRASFRTSFVMLLVSGFYLFSTQVIYSQDKASKQSSMDAFNRGDYASAYAGYSQLLVSFPKDPVYKYYSGVSLVKMEENPSKAETLLAEALSASSLKSLPVDAMFYLGRAQQMNGNYTNAEKSFRRFEQEAGKKKAREFNVQEFISQCRAGEGMLRNNVKIAAPPVTEARTEAVVNESSVPATAAKTLVSEEEDKKLDNLLENQYKADSIQRAGKPVLALQPPQKPAEAKTESIVPEQVTQPEQKVEKDNLPTVSEADPIKPSEAKPSESKVTGQNSVARPESSVTVQPLNNVQTPRGQANSESGVFSIFSVQEATQTKDVTVNPEIPEGLVYRVQIAVFRNPVAPAYFKGLSPIEGFKAPGATVTIYYAGLFRRAEDARKALAGVKGKGFKDSFIAAMMEGKTISAERAAVYEKEWGNRPLYKFETEQAVNQLDTVPPTLHFRVEVTRAQKPLSVTDVDALKKLAGNRGLDIIQLNSGDIAYLIGNFITFESADDYADLLQRNGHRDARVVAWLGRREIDVNTAKQLFDSLQ